MVIPRGPRLAQAANIRVKKSRQFALLTCVLIYAYHLISNFNGLFYHYHQIDPLVFSHLFNWRVLMIH